MARARSSASRSTPFRQTQSRSASTMPTRQTAAPPPPAAPFQAQPYPAAMAQPRQPGLFGQMAATAAGVAVGHSVGHAVTSAFGMGSSSHHEVPAEQQQPQPLQQQASYGSHATNLSPAASCDENAKAFTRCLDATNNDMSVCQFYLEQLKACQAFAAQQNL
ncbi:hypothetical protein K457DRAFT_137066 [Linnemannia elongata AG-77]|uniref:CHCH domain-containing protein n=1 Tax=Linnemannia elongata AG-77 TaxID=1314771 RepID=A0A197JYM7_9FUNG|nr:hypothetical protein K457DRAFT_137066 [Linnemannia elongata AG-77]